MLLQSKFQKYLYISLLIFIAFSCKQNQKLTQNNKLNEIISSTFDETENIHLIPNSDKSYTLCISYNETTSANPIQDIHFFVFDNKKKVKIFEKKYANAKIEWFSSSKLHLTRYFGIQENQLNNNIKHYNINIETKDIKEELNNKPLNK